MQIRYDPTTYYLLMLHRTLFYTNTRPPDVTPAIPNDLPWWMQLNNTGRLLPILSLLPLLLLTSACTVTDQRLVLLDAAVASADAAVVLLSSQGTIDPVVAAEVIAVLTPIPAAASGIVQEAGSSDSAAVKAAKITALAQPVVNGLSSVIDPAAKVYVNAVLVAWQTFISSVNSASAPVTAASVPAGTGKVTTQSMKQHINSLREHLVSFRAKR
jgi:hypothetical protein